MSGVDSRRILTFPAFCGSVDPMKKVRSITTGAGDAGKTKLFSGEEVSKNSLRTDAYGTIDELESILGVARVHADRDDVREGLLYVQRTLFIVAAELATTNALAQRRSWSGMSRWNIVMVAAKAAQGAPWGRR